MYFSHLVSGVLFCVFYVGTRVSCMHMAVRQLAGRIGSFLPPCEFWESACTASASTYSTILLGLCFVLGSIVSTDIQVSEDNWESTLFPPCRFQA